MYMRILMFNKKNEIGVCKYTSNYKQITSIYKNLFVYYINMYKYIHVNK